MTAAEFNLLQNEINISRAELCRRIGIALNTGTAYSKGRQRIPRAIALACAAVALDIQPYGTPED